MKAAGFHNRAALFILMIVLIMEKKFYVFYLLVLYLYVVSSCFRFRDVKVRLIFETATLFLDKMCGLCFKTSI